MIPPLAVAGLWVEDSMVLLLMPDDDDDEDGGDDKSVNDGDEVEGVVDVDVDDDGLDA